MIKTSLIIDFFEWKFNHRIIIVEEPYDRLRDFLEMELARALELDNERAGKDTLF